MLRILSLAPSATEIVCSVGAGNCLVGRTRFCTYPSEVQKLPAFGGWLDVDYDGIARLKPDLILTSTFLQNKIAQQLTATGYNVLHTDPITLQDVYESIRTIAAAVEKKETGEILIKTMQKELAAINLHGRKIYVEEWHKPPTASGNWVPDVLNAIKAQSILPSGIRSAEVTLEKLRTFDPDVLVLSWCGFQTRSNPEWVKERPGWNELTAVKKNRIIVLDDSLLNRPGPRLVEAAQQLSSILPFVAPKE